LDNRTRSKQLFHTSQNRPSFCAFYWVTTFSSVKRVSGWPRERNIGGVTGELRRLGLKAAASVVSREEKQPLCRIASHQADRVNWKPSLRISISMKSAILVHDTPTNHNASTNDTSDNVSHQKKGKLCSRANHVLLNDRRLTSPPPNCNALPDQTRAAENTPQAAPPLPRRRTPRPSPRPACALCIP